MGELLTEGDVCRLVGEVSVSVPSRDVRSHLHRRVCPGTQGEGGGGEREAQEISKGYVLWREDEENVQRWEVMKQVSR